MDTAAAENAAARLRLTPMPGISDFRFDAGAVLNRPLNVKVVSRFRSG